MNDRFVIKTEKFCEEISDLRKRIVNYNISIDGLDDSDIEFLEDEIDEASDDSEEEFAAIVQPVANEDEANEVDANDVDANEIDANETDANEIDANEVDSNTSNNIETVKEGDVSVSEEDANDKSHDDEQHDDVLNGSLRCVENDVKDGYYPQYDTSIRAPIANVLRAWNSSHPFNTYLYDKRFLGVLLREVFGGQMEELDEQRMAFVKYLFEVRVRGDGGRLNNFDAIVEEKQQKANSKNRPVSTEY